MVELRMTTGAKLVMIALLPSQFCERYCYAPSRPERMAGLARVCQRDRLRACRHTFTLTIFVTSNIKKEDNKKSSRVEECPTLSLFLSLNNDLSLPSLQVLTVVIIQYGAINPDCLQTSRCLGRVGTIVGIVVVVFELATDCCCWWPIVREIQCLGVARGKILFAARNGHCDASSSHFATL